MTREIVQRGDVMVKNIPYAENLIDPFTKTLIERVLDSHGDNIGIRCVLSLL